MNLYPIFAIQFLTSIIIYFILSYFFALPYLKTKSRHVALTILTLPHLIRHIGLTLLTPGVVVGANLNQNFATSTSVGDYTTLIFAIISIIALKKKSKIAIPMVWIFNVCGSTDIILALGKGISFQVLKDIGLGWFIIAFWVPLLLVAHILSLVILAKK